MKGLIVSAPSSGSGKTTVTLGLIRALRRQGVAVRAFKSGPDYIDPAFLRAASGRDAANLDTWAMSAARIGGLIGGGDLALAEGSMGLFDGVAKPGMAGNGSTADLAALTGWPVVLVLDASGQAQTAAAVAHGLATFRDDVQVAGVVLNRVASPRHEALIRHGMRLPVFGCLPRNAGTILPERHLGLVQAGETADLEARLDALADLVTAHLDLPAILAAAGGLALEATPPLPVPAPAERIALAQDDAFSFIYPHIIAGWRAQGATILPFSPLSDQAPDESAGACWLPGGYPELHAGRLAACGTFREGLRAFADGKPVHGECGGYMAMGAGIVDADGVRHEMAGLLGLETSFAKRKMHLGYRHATIGDSRLRGHEFHYATILSQPDAPLAHVTDANGVAVPETGSRRGYATGTFFHMIAEDA